MTIGLGEFYDTPTSREALLQGLQPLMLQVYSGCEEEEFCLSGAYHGHTAPLIGSKNCMCCLHVLADTWDTNLEGHNTDTEAK